jgi:signal transduction histidine kinase/transcriptional regulator with GAF, ATPase, and Fis domain
MDEGKQDNRLTSALKNISLAVTGSFDIDNLLQSIVETCTKFSNASRGALFLYDDQTKELVMRAEKGNAPSLRFTARYSTDVDLGAPHIGLTTYIFLKNEILILNSPDEILRHHAHKGKYDDQQYPGKQNCQSFVGIPLVDPFKKLPIGVLKIENTVERTPSRQFTNDEIDAFKLIADIASSSIVKFQQQVNKINLSINQLSSVLKSAAPLKDKLRGIVSTFKNISHADGASIWLVEGSLLVCKCGVGHYEGMEEAASYNLKGDIKGKIGLTAWIARTGETVNIKSYESLITHPMHKGSYDHKNYPNKSSKRCESFIGAPLRIGEDIIGVIKADNRISDHNHPENYFTEEEAQIFSYLAMITAMVVKNDQEFEKSRMHDRQLLALYQLGTECSNLEHSNAILWYLLTGLTHNEGLRFNRSILFDFHFDGASPILRGRMSIGPFSIDEGTKIQDDLDSRKLIVSLSDCKDEIRKANYEPPPSELQLLVQSTKIQIARDCPLMQLAISKDQPEVKKVMPTDLCINFQIFLEKIESNKTNPDGIIVFSIPGIDGRTIIGLADFVYSRAELSDFTIKAIGIFVRQISLSLSRLSLQKAQEDLRENAWKEFSATTAHCIGTEISKMSGALDGLMHELMHTQAGGHYISRLNDAIRQVKILVKKYTDLVRAPAMNRGRLNINALLEECVKGVFPANDSTRVNGNFSQEIPPLFGDSDQLRYAFTELLMNSRIELSSEGIIDLRTWFDRSTQNIMIEITDNGPGIKQEIIDRVFDPGVKGRPNGTGLGLYIVKNYVSQHGGAISVRNTPGASFLISLPFRSAFIYSRILVIEDTDDLRGDIIRVIRRRISSPDVVIDEARNEIEAINLLIKWRYDFVISDVKLNEQGGTLFGGIRVLETIKKNGVATKTIILTAHSTMTYRETSGEEKSVLIKAKELGADYCISRLDPESHYLDKIAEVFG